MTRLFATALLAASTAFALSACYDWQVGSAPADAAGTVDAKARDASRDARDARVGHDASADAPSGPTDTGTPAIDATTQPDATAPSCTELAANVTSTEALAQSCTLGQASECTTSVLDPCGCTTYVAQAGTTATSDYAAAVAAFTSAGCVATCMGCLDPGATSGTCLDMASGSSVTTACSP